MRTLIFTGLLLLGGFASLAESLPEESDVIRDYAVLVHANYDAALTETRILRDCVKEFIAEPSEPNLKKARNQWIEAHVVYGPSEAFRFYDGPIDNPENGPEGMINGWPLDEFYVDYVEGARDAGIINQTNLYPTLDKYLIAELNEKNGEENISSGFHAIEFLLWGQDASEDGPGARSPKDYIDAPNAKRRAQYLEIVTDLLVEHLESMVAAWDPESEINYAHQLKSEDPHEALTKIFTGIGMLAGDELVNERIAVAFETRDQEDEQSCFSDTTHLDLLANAEGIQNVYAGDYGKLKGIGLDELVPAKLNKKVRKQMKTAVKAVKSIPAPFDQSIQAEDGSPEREAVENAIDELNALSALLVEAADSIGVTLNIGMAE